MKSICSTWFEVGVRYKSTEEKSVAERYVIDAVSFTEVETRMTKEIADNAWQDCKIMSEAQVADGEIFFSENEEDDKWYKCKVAYINIG